MTALYKDGTVTLVQGSPVIVGNDTGWKVALIVGGTVFVEAEGGSPLPILPDDSDGANLHPITNKEMTAAIKWTGASGTYNYAIVRDMSYSRQQSANADALALYLQRLNNPSLAAVSGLVPEADSLILFTGPDTATVIQRSSLVQGVDYDEDADDIAGRNLYSSEAKGFSVLVANAGDGRTAIFIKRSSTDGDWSVPFYLSGPVGPKGDTGAIGIADAGVYSATSAYAIRDAVLDNGSTWLAKSAVPPGNPPPVLPAQQNDYWRLLARRGTDGTGIGDVVGPDGGVSVKQVTGFTDTTGKAIIGLTPEEVRIFAQVAKGGYAGRDYLINGNFRRWLRGTTQSTSGYGSHDRWQNIFSSSVMDSSRVSFTPGQTEVPGFPRFYVRTNWTPGPDAATSLAIKAQTIWDITKLAGKTVTITFWSRASYERPLPVELYQAPGSGGGASPESSFLAGTPTVTTSWQKFSILANVPSISGKVLGSNDNSRTEFLFWLDAGTNYASRTGGMARMPAGWIDFAMVSIVEGDATKESLPVMFYDPDIEGRRMDYYAQIAVFTVRSYATGAGQAFGGPMQWPEMRRDPDALLIDAGLVSNASDVALYNIGRWGCRPEVVSQAAGSVYAIARGYLLNAEA
jgi:hypothetical protein